MSANFTLTLDTTAPGGAALAINSGATYATSQSVTANVTTTDGSTTGYTMKLWGDVDNTFDVDVQTTEGASNWITFNATHAVKLSAGDGAKNLHCKIRDDVLNSTAQLDASITLDTTVPVVTIQAGSPDVAKVSKISGADTCNVTWQSDSHYQNYSVRVVPATGSLHTAGTEIPTTAGSSHTGGASGNATTNLTTVIKGTDLESASAGDGAKIVKIFVQDDAGNWSV